MLLKRPDDIKSSEITDKSLYLNRRTFIRGGVLAGTAAITATIYRKITDHSPATGEPQVGEKLDDVKPASPTYTVAGEKQTPLQDISHYNNFYEFSTDKRAVADKARNFVSRPWTVAVEGLAQKPRVFDIDDLLKISPLEERVYRHRCVEGWSMVIPWVGFSLSKLLDQVQPLASAKYVRFVTLADPTRMPNIKSDVLAWPYVEALRMDEALHPLTLLASGIYGETLLPQNGAPLKLVIPWKYGFKGIKSIVKIQLVADQPHTTWADYAPKEYGFYSNVNPTVDHPRWSQAQERRIGEFGVRPTLMFNGYEDQVAGLYNGMDLRANF